MKRFIFITAFSLIYFFIKAQDFVDTNTPSDALPENSNIGMDWTLHFSDEFNDLDLNLEKWQILVSTQSRAPRPNLGIKDWWWKSENVWLDNGKLILEVEKHDHNTMYCGSINTNNKYETTYGYFEVRMKIADAAKGTHTAFWFQGDQMSQIDGTANDGAEIDVFESAWLGDFTKSVVHIDGYGVHHQANTKQYNTPGIHDDYHIWGFHWTPEFMNIYYDGELKATYSSAQWIVQNNEYIWLSNGASFGLSGDYFTSQSNGTLTHAYVDYVRVWKEVLDTTNNNPHPIINGNFERASIEDQIWSKSNTDIKLHELTYPVYDNTAYCRMPGIGGERFISQEIVLESGMEYHFSFSGRIQNGHGASGTLPNHHASKGPATLKAAIFSNTDLIVELSIRSNENDSMSNIIVVPEDVNILTLKISKNWNVGYIDQVIIEKLVTTSKSTSTVSTSNPTIKIYPNPSNDSFKIQSDDHMESCYLIDINGKIVQDFSPSFNKEITVEMRKEKKAMYFLIIETTNGKRITQRIITQ